jgi:nucleoside-diphosphate-sugar epimerase
MKRVLVTGASGFIGSHCTPMLVEAGFEVHGVVPEAIWPNTDSVIWHTADLLERDEVHRLLADVRPTHLLHLAWFVAPGDYWASTENVRWLAAGLDLMREFADVGGKRSVVAGTCAEYAQSRDPLVEGETPLRPTTLYAACKLGLHVSSAAYFAERGVSAAWGHVFYLYGPGEHPSRLVPSVMRALRDGETFRCTHPNDVRDFLHVADVAGAFVALLGSEAVGDFNVASGEPTAVGSLVAAVAEAMGRPDLVEYSSSPEASRIVGGAARLRREAAWEPRFSLDEGVTETVSRWRADRNHGTHILERETS